MFVRLVLFTLLLISITECTAAPNQQATPSKATQAATSTVTTTAMWLRMPTQVTPEGSLSVEAEAKTYPSAPPPIELPALFKNTPGTAERECIAAGNYTSLRSGEFVAGNFRGYIEQWKPNLQQGKLWWVPLHSQSMRSLTVKAILLDDPKVSRTYGQSLVAEGEDGTLGYATNIPLPTHGTWRLVVTSGPDWGCFELTLE